MLQIFFQSNLDVFLTQYEPGYFASQGSSLTKCSFENDPLARKQNSLGSGYSGTIDESCEFNKEWLSDQGADYKCISEEDYGSVYWEIMANIIRQQFHEIVKLFRLNQ